MISRITGKTAVIDSESFCKLFESFSSLFMSLEVTCDQFREMNISDRF